MSQQKKNSTSFFGNLMMAFLAQGISLLMSVFMSFVVPKFLGVIEYSYWQLFIFYVGYVGFFHFGYNDGIYLRLGGKHYEKLDYKQLGTQFRILAVMQIVVALLIALAANFMVSEQKRVYVWVCAAIYLIFNNLHLFYGYVFQAVNETKIFSKATILDRVCVLGFMTILLVKRETSFFPFILTYTISKSFAFIYVCYCGKEILLSKPIQIKIALKDMWISFSCGIKLVIANLMSMLVLGIGRIVIDNAWGIEEFGKISLALSLTNFFLVFIQQVSMVLFPALRRTSEGKLRSIYNHIRIALGLLLPFVFICYFPIKGLVSLWLPRYVDSIKYLSLLLPLCTFDGKMQMLCNTYLKVLRQEKRLLQVNIISFLVSFILSFVSAYIFCNMTMVIVSMVFTIAFRSILAELYLSKLMGVKIIKMLIQEIAAAGIFMAATWFLDARIAFLIIICTYILFITINKKFINPQYFLEMIKGFSGNE
ncbi:MAG: hypothetical protein HFH58_01260 [Lachnospiraceae bacterium]|nr:hypothetical protein [Lachnospiraceae bacterium]